MKWTTSFSKESSYLTHAESVECFNTDVAQLEKHNAFSSGKKSFYSILCVWMNDEVAKESQCCIYVILKCYVWNIQTDLSRFEREHIRLKNMSEDLKLQCYIRASETHVHRACVALSVCQRELRDMRFKGALLWHDVGQNWSLMLTHMVALHIKMIPCYWVRYDEFKFIGKKSDPLPLGSQQNAKLNRDSRRFTSSQWRDVSSECRLLNSSVLQTLKKKIPVM